MDRQHLHLALAYIVTWVLQLGYLGWLVNRFSSQRKAEEAARLIDTLNKN